MKRSSTAPSCCRLVPSISPHCVGALVARRDGAADPHRTLLAFRRSCEAAGVSIHEGCGVTAIERRGADWLVRCGERSFTAPAIVNAAGAWAARIAALVGDDIALGMKASMMIVTERLAPLLDPVVSVVGRPLVLQAVGAGDPRHRRRPAGQRRSRHASEARSISASLPGARARPRDLFPAVRDVRITRAWTGMEAKTEDLIPVIGLSPNAPGVVHAFGFSGHGFQLVPVVGAIICDLLVHGGTQRQIAAFTAERLMARKAAA